jgi:exosome complex component RRP45
MPREAEPSVNERAFVLQALRENIRTDGRALTSFRNLHIGFGDEDGVVDVSLGQTRYTVHSRRTHHLRIYLYLDRVLVRVSAEITKPFPDRKFDGIFTITTELSPMASPAFEVGRSV